MSIGDFPENLSQANLRRDNHCMEVGRNCDISRIHISNIAACVCVYRICYVCVHIYICVYIHIHHIVCVCVCIGIYIYIYIYIYCICMYIQTLDCSHHSSPTHRSQFTIQALYLPSKPQPSKSKVRLAGGPQTPTLICYIISPWVSHITWGQSKATR